MKRKTIGVFPDLEALATREPFTFLVGEPKTGCRSSKKNKTHFHDIRA